MFCPYCGAKLSEESRGEYRCEASGAYFTPSLSQRFKQSFSEHFCAEQRRLPATISPSEWFCPACSVPMVQLGESIACPVCLRCLDTFLPEIVEFNPHF